MSSRRFPDFLKAYTDYANDRFAPPQFNTWSALSIVAGALERKVWLPWNDTFSYYPNIYVLLISMPGDGKSVALNKAIDLLQKVNEKTGTLNIMPNQVTEAKFIELMGNGKSFSERLALKEITHRQNAGYYWASEASNALKNIFGDFIACLTDFYDCPNSWERATKKDGKKIQLTNVCMNMIAGSTFDYLGKLVNDENIQGGFASRLIYVVSKNKEVLNQEFQAGGKNLQEKAERAEYRAALVEDLTSISKLVGPMHADREFGKAWEEWYPTFERDRRKLESEKLQSLIARANTNILKVAMLLSAAESDDRELRLTHWNKAIELVLPIYDSLPALFRQARANSSIRSNSHIADAVVHLVERLSPITTEKIHGELVKKGFGALVITQTINALVATGTIEIALDQTVKVIRNS